jgi:putative flippase GtrA
LPLSRSQLVIRYAGFAVLASLANLGVQRIVLGIASGWYMAALLAGTLIGLILKYALDKRWIFFDQLADLHGETRKFGLYTLTGVGTTALFWGSETLFWIVWQTHAMREAGALLGLTAGYVIKYRLDDRYVFRKTGAGRSYSQQE